ncbi:hypothetical protein [Profundibacter sp.]
MQMLYQRFLSLILTIILSFAFRSALSGLALGLLVTPIYADSELGTQIKASGIVTHVDRNGVFSIEGSPYKFRLYEVELKDFSLDRAVGERWRCVGVYPLEVLETNGRFEGVVPAECRFEHGLLYGQYVTNILVGAGLARRKCDPEGHYFGRCPYE